MTIENDILRQLNIESYNVKQRFFSRRNEVYLIEAFRKSGVLQFVYKSYVSGDNSKEYECLCKTHMLNVPKVIAKGHSALCLSYIGGQLLLERFEKAEQYGLCCEPLIDAFLNFLDSFYSALPGYIYGDINFRNFICIEDQIWGVDLEDAGQGRIEVDIGKAAAFLLSYRPARTSYKQEAADYLIAESCKRFNLHKSEVLRERDAELKCMAMRRVPREGQA